MKKIEKYNLPEHLNKLYLEEASSSIGLVRETADKINELVDAYNKLSEDDLDWKQTEGGKINKAVLYMKDNLINSINELFELLKESGEFDNIITETVLNEFSIIKDKTSGYVTVKQFGANGNGIHDDTKAIQKAINHAISEHKNVYIPEGEYVISDTLKIYTLGGDDYEQMKAPLIYGDGLDKTIFKARLKHKPVFLFEHTCNGAGSNGKLEDITIKPYDVNYANQFDGIKLINSVGNKYKNIIIEKANHGLILTTHGDTSISPLNTGFCEHNLFENVSVSGCIYGVTFKAGENDSKESSFHGNMFERCGISTSSGDKKVICINFESGYIYNCVFNIRVNLSGTKAYLMHINCTSGSNRGDISYECFTGGHGAKISTGSDDHTYFSMNGNIYGLGNVDWSDYKPNSDGKERFYCLNLCPPVDISVIKTYEKPFEVVPLFNHVRNFWSGIQQTFLRYRNTDGSTENGYIMGCREMEGAGARFILGTLPETNYSMDEFNPGFYFYANGGKIENARNKSNIQFKDNGIYANGSKIRTANDESFINDYNGRMKFAGGFTIVWGAKSVNSGSISTQINVTGLTTLFGVQAIMEGSTDADNLVMVSNMGKSGFKLNTKATYGGLVYWIAYGYTA